MSVKDLAAAITAAVKFLLAANGSLRTSELATEFGLMGVVFTATTKNLNRLSLSRPLKKNLVFQF